MAQSFLSTKRIPTIVGIVILSAGLIGGIFLANSVTTGFLPRASPESTPKNLKITNVTDTSFTVSWVTDSKTTGYVKYGPSSSSISSVTTDDRDQIGGSVGQFKTHHVTLRGLTASTTYFYKIGTGTSELYDDSGKPYQTKTTVPITSPAKTLYGEVLSSDTTGATGALIYISGDSIAPLSTITQSGGSFALSLAIARAKDGVSSATFTDDTKISLLVISPIDDTTSVIDATISQGQPFPDIVLGKNQNLTSPTQTPQPEAENTSAPTQSKFTSQLLSAPVEIPASVSANFLSISAPTDQFVSTVARPVLSGTASKSATVSLALKGPSTLTTSTKATATGAWTYTPVTSLKNGAYTLTASTTISGKKETQNVSFSILVPTPTPKTSTASAVLGLPSTESADLVSGSTEITISFALAGLLFIGSGAFFATIQSSDHKKRK
ncbi:MAG: fibronectin type III domain-containing protein [Candidatus Woesebacteria bacterium]